MATRSDRLRNRNSETLASPSPAGTEGNSPAGPRRSLRGAGEADDSKALASALGLKRVDDPEDDEEELESESAGSSPTKSRGGLELNRRGIPARKRKKNSLIYGTDDLVSIPVRSPKKRGTPGSAVAERRSGRGGSKSENSTPVQSPAKKAKTAKAAAAAATAQPAENLDLDVEEVEKSVKKEKDDVEEEEPAEDLDDSFDESEMERDITEAATAFVDVGAPIEDDGSPSQEHKQKPPQIMARPSPKKRLNFDDPPPKDVVKSSPVPATGQQQRKKPTKRVVKSSPKKMLAKLTAAAAAMSAAEAAGDLELSSPEKKHAQSLGVALRNLLKLPKAHKWVCYEFFYSNLDKVLFEGENDFMVCLRESFPQMKTRRLTRVEWCKIRRLMGKPRRCSSAFFAEERAELLRKRTKIRLLQQRKQNEVINYKDLPDLIPLQLTIGTRVTARLRKPQDGLFMGTVDAYDTSNNTYRIRFDRTGLGGTHSVRDEEVLSVDPAEAVPLSSFMQRVVRPRPQPAPPTQPYSSVFASPVKPSAGSVSYSGGWGIHYSPQLANDPLLSGSTPRGKTMRIDGQVGGYPVKFLEQIVRLSKILKLKREKIGNLRELNSHGERKKSFGAYINEDFQRKYASTVIELSTINRDLNEHLKNIQDFTQEFALEAGPTISLPNIIREGCHEDAYDLVNKNNSNSAGDYVQNPKILGLISSFTALMLHIKKLSDGERNSFELEALQESLREVKSKICAENVGKFENCVEVHVKHIQSGLSQMGNLHAFMRNSTPSKANKIIKASGRAMANQDKQKQLTPVIMKTEPEATTSAWGTIVSNDGLEFQDIELAQFFP